MAAMIMQSAAVSDIVLPSFEDEAEHFGDATPQITADHYTHEGASSVIVKNGADPEYFNHEGETGDVPVEPVARVVDTTSVGDSFNAVFFAGLDAGLPIVARIELGASVARQVIGGRGALVALDLSRIAYREVRSDCAATNRTTD